MPIELMYPMLGLTFLAVCTLAMEILLQVRREGQVFPKGKPDYSSITSLTI